MWETWVQSLAWKDPLEKGKATHSSILAWRIPWTVQSMGLQRVGHDWATFTFTLHSGRQWRTGEPGVLQSMGSQRVGHDLKPEWQQPCTESQLCQWLIWKPESSRSAHLRSSSPFFKWPCFIKLLREFSGVMPEIHWAQCLPMWITQWTLGVTEGRKSNPGA